MQDNSILTCNQTETDYVYAGTSLPSRNAEKHALRLAYGADAVYAGQPRYSLRVRNNEFNHENLAQGISDAHALGKKF